MPLYFVLRMSFCKCVYRKRLAAFVSHADTIQPTYNAFCFFSVTVSLKNFPHNSGFRLVDNPMLVYDIVTKLPETADKVAFLVAFTYSAFYFLGKFGGVILRHAFQYAFN